MKACGTSVWNVRKNPINVDFLISSLGLNFSSIEKLGKGEWAGYRECGEVLDCFLFMKYNDFLKLLYNFGNDEVGDNQHIVHYTSDVF